MRLLQRVDRDTHEAVLWLEQHRHLFNKHVFEPILLSVSLFKRKSTTVCTCNGHRNDSTTGHRERMS